MKKPRQLSRSQLRMRALRDAYDLATLASMETETEHAMRLLGAADTMIQIAEQAREDPKEGSNGKDSDDEP